MGSLECNDEMLSGASQNVTRRNVLRGGIGLGLSVSALGGLLAACGSDDDEAEIEATSATTDSQPTDDESPTATDQAAVETPEAAQSQSTPGERPSEEATGEEAVLNIGMVQEPITLDPHLSTSYSDQMLFNVYARLVYSDRETGEVLPELATDWEISSDGLDVTFSLQEGVLFHDGTPFNAEAALVNFERCIALKSFLVEAFENIAELEAVDDLTLKVTLIEPLAPFVVMLTSNPKMISPAAIEEHRNGDDYARTWLTDNTAGSGAYTVVRWDLGSNLQLEAFPEYWKGWEGKHVTTVNQRFVAEAGTQRLMIESGDLDVQTIVTPDSLDELRANPDLNVMSADQPNQLYIRLNNFDGPTSDVRVRKAISYGFNYDEYVLLLNLDPPPRRADMPIPVQLFGPEYEAVEIPYYTYDPDMAKTLLDEAGYSDGFSMNIFTDDSTVQKTVLAEYFQASMAQIGIDVSITVEPFTNILARGTDQELQKTWETAIHSWVLYTAPSYSDPSYFLIRMYTPYPNSVRNLLGYESEKVTRLTGEGLRSTDPEVSNELYWEANLQIVEDCPDLVLDRSIAFEILRTYVKGHIPHTNGPFQWTYWNIWKEM